MKNRGFTLIEIMAVIVVLLLLVLIVFPSVINVLKDSSNKIDAATEVLILDAAKEEVEMNKNKYPRDENQVVSKKYYISIQALIDKGHLMSELKEGTNSDDINKMRCIEIEVTKDGKYNYKLLKTTSECD